MNASFKNRPTVYFLLRTASIPLLFLHMLVWSSSAAEPGLADLQAEQDKLRVRVDALEAENQELRESIQEGQSDNRSSGRISLGGDFVLSGEGGLIFLDTGKEGARPNEEFRVDEARFYVDARLLENVYFFMEMNLAERERNRDTDVKTGELYVDFESLIGNDSAMLNLRVGRLDIPFGEEYLVRDAHDNPLISHSLADFWGIDEGVEVYGVLGPVDYVFAVQNGGVDTVRDFDGDKSLTLRLGIYPVDGLRVSVSAMRTGDLDPEEDRLSELWFGNGFVRSLSPPDEMDEIAASAFGAEIFQGDVRWSWAQGHLWVSAGVLSYSDDDPAVNYDRDVSFYSIEGVQSITRRVYAAARYSQLECDEGFPVVGQGPFGQLFSPVLTTDIERLSLGGGIRWSDHCSVKAEYSFETGENSDGEDLDNRDQIGLGVTYAF